MPKFILIYFIFILFDIYGVLSKFDIKEKIITTGLLRDRDDQTLLISTLDGTLHAVLKSTGEKKWTLKDSPIIQNQYNLGKPAALRFFPNPQDGSLYRYTFGRDGKDPLKKLPFTIPELVANSPCRSNDGIFYIGKKTDSWIGIDIFTGKKQFVLGMESTEKVCPKPSRNTIYIGRTLYNIMFYELQTGHRWNVSYYDYSINSKSELNHDQNHFVSTGEGSMLTFNLGNGAPLWKTDFDSPVVAIYQIAADNSLVSVPVTAVTPEILQRFMDQMDKRGSMEPTPSEDMLIKEFRYYLKMTTYVGDSENGVYALPALIDGNTARLSMSENHLLLNGPEGQRGLISKISDEDLHNFDKKDLLIFGYYDTVDNADIKIDEMGKTVEGEIAGGLPLRIAHKDNSTTNKGYNMRDDQDMTSGFKELRKLNVTFIFSREFVKFTETVLRTSYQWVFEETLHVLVTLILAFMVFISGFVIMSLKRQAHMMRELSSRKAVSSSRGSNSGHDGGEITAIPDELESGDIRVGKITYCPAQRLGKGCEGTFVYRGTFDGRQIAVKRILPNCFSVADREVDLLRASDQHPNVVRYYCMEQCREFRYIALELCAATLEDLVCGRYECNVSRLDLLQEATAGLAHLHSLDIVHRDVKPQNVLLSLTTPKGKTIAMISDFGLCKKLDVGRTSFSKRSGITGTDGWIAPEMLTHTISRPTAQVDIFSLGCVYYYVLTKGRHPFGLLLDRQSNIINNKPNLSHLYGDNDILSKTLIENMIKHKPTERPPSSAVLSYPLFWAADKTLQFLQDVSDRVENEASNSFILRKLETGACEVVRDDWTNWIHPSVSEDLKKFRLYKGRSVRDLLRALRNKKNHYRELPEEAQRIYGSLPVEFVQYWIKLFPLLLLHSWYALQYCKSEAIFNKYYSANYNFKREDHQSQTEQDEHHYQTVSLSPNNRRAAEYPDVDRSHTKVIKRKQIPKKRRDGYDFLDSLLGPPVGKGPSKLPKHEADVRLAPSWIIHKPINTFEPKYVHDNPTVVKQLEVENKESSNKD